MVNKTAVSREIETDVVVVGYGSAGSAAAITAHDNGAQVIILEELEKGGGASFVAAGGIFIPTSMELVDYLDAICLGNTDRDILETLVKNSMDLEEYFREIGGDSERWISQNIGNAFPNLGRPSWPKAPFGKSFVRCHIKDEDADTSDGSDENLTEAERIRKGGKTYGPALWKMFSSAVESRGIKIMTKTRARELVQNDDGEITGVIAENQGEKILFKAKKAVILTCGGFAANTEMQRNLLPFGPLYYMGPENLNGDGVIMAQKAGAGLWHMNALSGQLSFKAEEYYAAFQVKVGGERFIYVDKYGKRFTDETILRPHDAWRAVSYFDSYNLDYPRVPSYLIFDEVTRMKAPLVREERATRDYEWSLDNSAEIDKGWITKGETIAELAEKLSIDASVLADTVAKYNEYCKSGVDTEFSRPQEYLGPIDKAPYYALKLSPCILSTSGGPRHDKESRILDTAGKPIPRLYAAGELSCMWGGLYEAGGAFAECIVFGRIAGKNAADEKPLA